MRRVISHTLLALYLSTTVVPFQLSYADDHESYLCTQFPSAEEYVRNALAVCLQDVPSRRNQCMRDAEIQFSRCHYSGAFRHISNRMQTKIILLSFFRNLVAPKRSEIGLAKR